MNLSLSEVPRGACRKTFVRSSCSRARTEALREAMAGEVLKPPA